jgi:PhnB protein
MNRRTGKVPEEFHTITPHLCVRNAAKAVEFYRDAFGAQELYRSMAPDGESIRHCEMLLGDSRFFLVDENPQWGGFSPLTFGGTGVTLQMYVADADVVFERALAAGAKAVMPLQDCFWGDRFGILLDPLGHQWSIATRIEDLTPTEIDARAKAHLARIRDPENWQQAARRNDSI